MKKNIAIKVFKFYGINPVDPKNSNAIDYKQIRKIKINKQAIKEKRITIKLKGEDKMNNEELKEVQMNGEQLKTDTQMNNEEVQIDVTNMSALEIEKIKLVNKKAEYKRDIDKISPKPSETKYLEVKDVKNPTTSQQNIINSYLKFLELQELIEKIEKEEELLEPFLAAIDAGKYNTKYGYALSAQSDLITGVFPSKVERVSECRHDNGVKFFVNNKTYALSSARRVTEDRVNKNPDLEDMVNTKAHEYHRVLMLKALYEIYDKTGRRVFNTVVGTSIDSYLEDKGARVYLAMLDEKLPPELQEEVDRLEEARLVAPKNIDKINEIYMNYVEELKEKRISKSFVVRETGKAPVTLIINDLYIAPETITGATKVDAKGLEYAIIGDLGGLNDTFLPIVNYSAKSTSLVSSKQGMTEKYKKIAHLVETRSNFCLDSAGIEVMINNYDNIDPELNYYIKAAVFEIFDDMVGRIKDTGSFQPGMVTMIFIGGGSSALAPYLKDYFTEVIDLKGKLYIADDNGIYLNVAGMYDSGEVYFDERMYSYN